MSVIDSEKRDYWPEEETKPEPPVMGQIVCVQQNPADRCGLEMFVSTEGAVVKVRLSKKKLANLVKLGIEAIATE